MRNPSAEMFSGLAQTLTADAADDPTFGTALVRFLRSLARFDHCVIFAYSGELSPLDLFHTFTPTKYRLHVTLYQPGAYLLDPFFRAASARREGFWRMRELAPDRFYQSEYFRSYYFETGLAEEVGFFVATDEATEIVLSLMRAKDSGAFSKSEAVLLRACEPVVRALILRQWQDVGLRFTTPARSEAARKARTPSLRPIGLAAWRTLNLTVREAAVVDLVLQGHSTESVASRLAIAPGTVKVHRRNVYRKLGISSQTELLAIYVDRIVRRVAAG